MSTWEIELKDGDKVTLNNLTINDNGSYIIYSKLSSIFATRVLDYAPKQFKGLESNFSILLENGDVSVAKLIKEKSRDPLMDFFRRTNINKHCRLCDHNLDIYILYVNNFAFGAIPRQLDYDAQLRILRNLMEINGCYDVTTYIRIED